MRTILWSVGALGTVASAFAHEVAPAETVTFWHRVEDWIIDSLGIQPKILFIALWVIAVALVVWWAWRFWRKQ